MNNGAMWCSAGCWAVCRAKKFRRERSAVHWADRSMLTESGWGSVAVKSDMVASNPSIWSNHFEMSEATDIRYGYVPTCEDSKCNEMAAPCCGPGLGEL